MVVFSLTDRRSFQKADDFVYDIRKAGHTDEAVILVANKSDLVRGRLVSENGELRIDYTSYEGIANRW